MINNQISKFRNSGLPPRRREDSHGFDSFDERNNLESSATPNASFWKILWPRKRLILGCGLACGTVAFLTSLFQPALYRARVSLEIQDLNYNFLQLSDIDPVSRGAGQGDSYMQTQLDELTSSAILSRVAARLHMTAKYRPTAAKPGLFDYVREKMGLSRPAVETPKELAVSEIRSNLSIAPARGTSRVVTIEYTSHDPQFAADFANTLADEFIEQGVELRMSSVQHLRDWLTRELDHLRTKLQSSEDELQKYGQSSGLLFTDEKNSVAEAKLKQLQEELSQAQADRMLKQSKYELADKATPEGLAQLMENGPIREYELRLADTRQQLAQAKSLYTPNHYKVKQLQAQVNDLESSLENQRREILNQVEGDYNAARRREALLSEAYSQQAALVSSQDIKASRYNILKGEVDTNRQLYDSMLQKLKNINMAAAMHAGAAAVFDPAEVPSRPFEPRPELTFFVGLLSGLLLGGIYVFLRNRWANRLNAPGELESLLHIPELGAIPSIQAVGSGWHKNRLSPAHREAIRGAEHAVMRGQLPPQFANNYRGGSLIIHSFRSILASLVFSGEGQLNSSVLVVTSPSPREGKTTTAANLAVTLASVGKRVLLVDADLIKPRLHQVFSIAEESGLSDLLLEKSVTGTIQLSDYVRKLDVPGLFLLTGGSVRVQASNQLYGSQVAELYGIMRQQFDFVVVDSPPILPVADARLLSWHADGVVLVVRAGTTDREAAKIATDRLLADGAHIIGTVLNDFDPRLTANYHRYYEVGSLRES
jgi:polysaccharide biosynthesis transport protein